MYSTVFLETSLKFVGTHSDMFFFPLHKHSAVLVLGLGVICHNMAQHQESGFQPLNLLLQKDEPV